MLAKAPSIIAFGEPPQTASLGEKEEFDKGLTALLLRGGHSVLIDNLNNQTLRSNALCSSLSERPAFLRIMGLGKLGPVNSTALISLTGCALAIGRDLVRRTITIDLDAKIEDPEQREFQGDFLADIAARRIELLQYVFTILRWARQNPAALKRGKPLGSYGMWCTYVRDALLTLGCPDPVARLAELKVKDPDRINVFGVFETWWRHHFDGWVTANQLNWDVQALLLHGRKFSRQRINHEVRQLIGTRIAKYLLQEKKSDTDKWAAAEFRLIKTVSSRAREGYYDQPNEAAATPDAAAAEAIEEAAATTASAAEDNPDDWQFHREPDALSAHAAPKPAESSATERNAQTLGKLFITTSEKEELKRRKFTDEEIYTMRTDHAQEILADPTCTAVTERYRNRIVGDAPANTPCLICGGTDGVKLIKDIGTEPKALHVSEACADKWFANKDLPLEEGPEVPPSAPRRAAARRERVAPKAPLDAFNAEGRVAVWRNAFAPLKADVEPCPGWRSDEWARAHACIKQFLAGPAAFAAARNGWTVLDLFAVHKTAGVAVRDCVGALTGNATHGFVARVEADEALQFANGTKARQRPLDSDLCIPIWGFRASTTAPR